MLPLQDLPSVGLVPGVTAFNGAFGEDLRRSELAHAAKRRRCGFMAPSGFDVIRDYAPLKRCRAVVLTAVMRGHGTLLNPQGVGPHNEADERICFMALMDIDSALLRRCCADCIALVSLFSMAHTALALSALAAASSG